MAAAPQPPSQQPRRLTIRELKERRTRVADASYHLKALLCRLKEDAGFAERVRRGGEQELAEVEAEVNEGLAAIRLVGGEMARVLVRGKAQDV